VDKSFCRKNPDLLIGMNSLDGGADGDRTRCESIPTHDLSIRPLSHQARDFKGYSIPFVLSSSLPSTDFKYRSLEAALDRVGNSSL
jgi:hypothetical protein